MSDEEKLELALWCLTGNRCWLGVTVERKLGHSEYVGIYQPGPYSACEVVPMSYSEDLWTSLRLSRRWFDESGIEAKP